jgi:hypothetical protein
VLSLSSQVVQYERFSSPWEDQVYSLKHKIKKVDCIEFTRISNDTIDRERKDKKEYAFDEQGYVIEFKNYFKNELSTHWKYRFDSSLTYKTRLTYRNGKLYKKTEFIKPGYKYSTLYIVNEPSFSKHYTSSNLRIDSFYTGCCKLHSVKKLNIKKQLFGNKMVNTETTNNIDENETHVNKYYITFDKKKRLILLEEGTQRRYKTEYIYADSLLMTRKSIKIISS